MTGEMVRCPYISADSDHRLGRGLNTAESPESNCCRCTFCLELCKETSNDEITEVFGNVFSCLFGVTSAGMVIAGAVVLKDCQQEPISMLGIYLILHGVVILGALVMYGINRCCKSFKRTLYMTLTILLLIVHVGCMIAGCHWVNTATCYSADLYKVSRGFVVAVWLLSLLLTAGVICLEAFKSCREKRRENEAITIENED
ncbi:uncharacterized protein LOC124121157 isoform X1 [Haliotis rufescens]|uniref:uncharacterized protein LOC124121157 isoform X1 n=1 Tax=Haliotis rufescens TaxID=6454 RepID=UPI00201EE0E8|nr:uncharacterized protein LOC124121157 isoform X1 [Haliotis rufescens]XP_046340098.2 uncharacterized protein LOC124121157 isoform X1 [Haliotis rufescens]